MNANEMLLCTNNLSTDEYLEVASLSYTLYVHRRYKFVILYYQVFAWFQVTSARLAVYVCLRINL